MNSRRSTLDSQLPRPRASSTSTRSRRTTGSSPPASRRGPCTPSSRRTPTATAPSRSRRGSPAKGADRFAVANPEEGAALRRGGVGGEILVLSRADPADVPRLAAYGLTPALYDRGAGRGHRAAAARKRRAPLRVHLELDTGMGRAGFRPEELDFVIALLRGAPGLRLAGTFANLSRADDPSSPETARQVERLRAGAARLREAGVAPGSSTPPTPPRSSARNRRGSTRCARGSRSTASRLASRRRPPRSCPR